MRNKKNLVCFLISFILFSCSNETTNKNSFQIQSNQQIEISLQPFSEIKTSDVKFVQQQLLKVYKVVNIKEKIALPKQAFNKERNRYRADTIINVLNRIALKNEVIIGLTTHDISTTKDSIKDWGVMGLGFCPGKACVASTFRLDKRNIQLQLFKVAIHELGHTQGLPHCPKKYCFMRDAEGKNYTNDEKEFCSDCKNVLIEKGFDL